MSANEILTAMAKRDELERQLATAQAELDALISAPCDHGNPPSDCDICYQECQDATERGTR